MKRGNIVVLLVVLCVLAWGCGPKKPVILEKEEPVERGEIDRPEIVQPDKTFTSPFGERSPSAGDLGRSASDPYNLKAVYFDFDRYDLRSDTMGTLNNYAGVLRKNPDVRLRLEGHCDERGTLEYNQALGDRRANSVFRYLVDLGINPARLSTVSFGEEFPADPGHTEAAWALNRRVEFRVVE